MIRYLTLAEMRERWPDPRLDVRPGRTIRTADGVVYCAGKAAALGGLHPEPQKARYSVRDWFSNDSDFRSYFGETRTWAGAPFNAQNLPRKPMKPGPFKSSTHGNIPLSLRGRELLAAERDAVQGVLLDGNFSTSNQALSRARGDLAKYMGDLEARVALAEIKLYPAFTGLRGSGVILDDPLNTKEKTMNDKTNGEAGPAAEKSRSQLIGEAAHELVQAQLELEYILKDASSKPDSVYVNASTGTASVGSYMRGSISTMVRDQWPQLAKKATARAKARVAKAEKAVAALLAG